jgi:hypothetical protein
VLAIAVFGWGALAIAGAALLAWKSHEPGATTAPPPVFPASLTQHRVDGLTTVFVALHPRCPCSRATIGNLERALAKSLPHNIVALVYTPRGAAPDWASSDTVRRIAAAGAHTVADADGRAAASLGMQTSGQVVAYDRAGRLAFSGGVTPSRAHEGDCAGLTRLTEILNGRDALDAAPTVTGVYGCPLCNGADQSICTAPPAIPQ